MKILVLTAAVFILNTFTSCTPAPDLQREKAVLELLKQKQMFQLRRQYELYQTDLSEAVGLQIQSHLLKSFNRNEASNAAIDQLIGKYEDELHDSLLRDLYELKAGNYLMLFDYNSALEANEKLLNEFSHVMDSAFTADILGMNDIYKPLIHTAPQEVIILEDNVIPIHRDVAGFMNVDLSFGDSIHRLIFDTGAGMSVIKRSFAEELGLEILETSIDVNAATGNVVKSSLAVAESLKMGSITAKNVVFLVLEDKDLDFEAFNFFPLGIIGFPLIKELQEISISQTDTLFISSKNTSSDLRNLRFEGLSPHLSLFNGKDTLEYSFDTGAAQSHFTHLFFEKYRSQFDTELQPDTIQTGSAGGMQSHLAYKIDSTSLYIGKEKAVLRDINCHIEANHTFSKVYGNLGQDLISQFEIMTINFREMYLEFK